jgi:hypothetical protein
VRLTVRHPILRGRAALLAVVALAVLGLAACSQPADSPAHPADARMDALRILGALPPEAAARGVYVIRPAEAGAFSPGSRLAPLLGALGEQARLLVETAAPPMVVLAGVPDDAVLPGGAERLDGLVVLAADVTRAEFRRQLTGGTGPRGLLAQLAAVQAPVAYAGPLPGSPTGSPTGGDRADGTFLLARDAGTVRIDVRADAPPAAVVEVIRARLADGHVPGSPGRPWRALLEAAEVAVDGRLVRVTATPVGLEGPLLRRLVDDQALTFLP